MKIPEIDNINLVYNEVDKILSTYQKNQIIYQAVTNSLHKMLNEKYFSLITIYDCAELCNIFICSDRINLYKTQHCINWSQMTEEFKQLLIAMVLDDFRSVLNLYNTVTVQQIQN